MIVHEQNGGLVDAIVIERVVRVKLAASVHNAAAVFVVEILAQLVLQVADVCASCDALEHVHFSGRDSFYVNVHQPASSVSLYLLFFLSFSFYYRYNFDATKKF